MSSNPAGGSSPRGTAHPSKPDPKTAAEPRVSYVIARLERAVRRGINQIVQAYELTTLQYTLLSILGRNSGLSNAQLARRSYVTPQSMHEMLQILEDKGLVSRPPASNQRLVRPAYLTDKGRRVLALCDEEVDRFEDEMMEGLDRVSRQQLLSWLKVCVRNFHAGFPS